MIMMLLMVVIIIIILLHFQRAIYTCNLIHIKSCEFQIGFLSLALLDKWGPWDSEMSLESQSFVGLWCPLHSSTPTPTFRELPRSTSWGGCPCFPLLDTSPLPNSPHSCKPTEGFLTAGQAMWSAMCWKFLLDCRQVSDETIRRKQFVFSNWEEGDKWKYI